jgi:putative transposase
MDERIRFVIQLQDRESMASLCREFGISRKTGYKILERYQECGMEGLTDRARRPHRYANSLPQATGGGHPCSQARKAELGRA